MESKMEAINMYSTIIKSYLEESTDILDRIYPEIAEAFEGRHSRKNREFVTSTPAYAKSLELIEALDGMARGDESLKKAVNLLCNSISTMYSFISTFYYVCGVLDWAEIKDDTEIEEHIEEKQGFYRAKWHEGYLEDSKEYKKALSDFENLRKELVEALGDGIEDTIRSYETSVYESKEVETIISYMGGIFDARLVMKYLREYLNMNADKN
jgi:hypothetical protein